MLCQFEQGKTTCLENIEKELNLYNSIINVYLANMSKCPTEKKAFYKNVNLLKLSYSTKGNAAYGEYEILYFFIFFVTLFIFSVPKS